MEISATTLSEITDRVIPKIKQWQNRSLESMYTIVWMDVMYFKVRHEGKVKTRVLYNVLGINQYGYKELLGMYFSKSEGAMFWMQALTDLQNRGVEDILIACIDNLSGFAEAIQSIYPHTSEQALLKLVYLESQEMMKKWTSPLQNWGLTVQQLAIHFGKRMKVDLL